MDLPADHDPNWLLVGPTSLSHVLFWGICPTDCLPVFLLPVYVQRLVVAAHMALRASPPLAWKRTPTVKPVGLAGDAATA